MKVEARLNNLKIAPRKVRLVTRSIAGMPVGDALIELGKQVKRSSEPMEKLLRSAIANAENNFGLDKSNLFVESVFVNEGTRLKRFQPHAFGRATPVFRRLSKIVLVLDEQVEGLNRKVRTVAEAKEKTVTIPAEEDAVSEKETIAREQEAKKVDEHLKLDEKKREVSMKQEMKERKNVVKKTYQRKSF
jgi:large subunit ribosomal protein L22